MRKNIGIAGYEGAGKDTVASILVKQHGLVRVGLADSLRDLALVLDPCLPILNKGMWKPHLSQLITQYGWDVAKREFPEVRAFMQTLGAEGCRKTFGSDCWIKACEKKIDRYFLSRSICEWRGAVIPDIRFENEANWVKGDYGFLIWVNREGYGPINDHASAQGLVRHLADIEVNNDGTYEELEEKILVILKIREKLLLTRCPPRGTMDLS